MHKIMLLGDSRARFVNQSLILFGEVDGVERGKGPSGRRPSRGVVGTHDYTGTARMIGTGYFKVTI